MPFLREAVNAIIKCLGLDESKPSVVEDDIKNSSSCSKEKDGNSYNTNKEQSCQDDQSSYTAPDGQPSPSDPPSTITDPADDPPMVRIKSTSSFYHFFTTFFCFLFSLLVCTVLRFYV